MRDDTRVLLEGPEYDIYRAAELDSELAGLAGRAVLDFQNVSYGDSTCLNALVHALNRMRGADPNSSIVLTNLSSNMRRIIAICGLDRIFEIR